MNRSLPHGAHFRLYLCLAIGVVILFLNVMVLPSYHSAISPSALVFSNKPHVVHDAFKTLCLGDTPLAISAIDVVSKRFDNCHDRWTRETGEFMREMYDFSFSKGYLTLPGKFQEKVKKWLGHNPRLYEEVFQQTIVTVQNRITFESTVFNPLRSKRPGVTATGAEEYIKKLHDETVSDCDFCHYNDMTAQDTFGRIDSTHSFSAANTFKYDGAHGLVMFKHHDPLHWTEAEFTDVMKTVEKWFLKHHEMSPSLLYPHLMWDVMPKASASQFHPHLQISLNDKRYYGQGEALRSFADQYSKSKGVNYFTRMVQIHDALGLAYSHHNVSALAYLTPKRDWEVWVIGEQFDADFVAVLHHTLRIYVDDWKLYAFSLGMFLPTISPSSSSLPAIARIVDRGAVTSPRSDISAMELFAQSNVNQDPFVVGEKLRAALKKRLSLY